jgi:hypothetical protein
MCYVLLDRSGKISIQGQETRRKGGKHMVTLFSYIFLLAIVFAILVGLVFMHMFFGLHRVGKFRRSEADAKQRYTINPLHLHDVIFSRVDI